MGLFVDGYGHGLHLCINLGICHVVIATCIVGKSFPAMLGSRFRQDIFMPAIHAAQIPSSLTSAFGLFRHPRRGLIDPTQMPRIERSLAAARIDAAWLRTYCECVGLHSNEPALPALALQIAAAPLHLAILADARFPFRALGLVHLSQQVAQTCAISPTASIDLLAYTTDAQWEKRGMSFGLVTEARVDGELCWQATTRALALGKSPTASTSAPRNADDDSTPPRFEQVIDVPENCGRRYAKIAGDLNPIHQHALLAKPFGFKRAIVHGTWTLARALAVAGLPHSERFKFTANFRRPVELPSRILVRAFGDIHSSQPSIVVQNAIDATMHLRVEFETSAV